MNEAEKLKILIVEDDPQMQYVCRRMLNKKFAITIAPSCSVGMEEMKKAVFDILLLDLKMPGMPPEEFLKVFKRERPDCQVIAMTGFPEFGLVTRILKQGINEFLSKPFDMSQLISVVDRCASRRALAGKNMLAGKKVLLVEDDERFGELIGILLQNYSASVMRARDGEAALLACASEKPDLVLTDLLLPGISGYDICRQFKANENYKNIPIVIMSAHLSPEYREEALKAGANFFITKPTNPFDLMEALERVISTDTR